MRIAPTIVLSEEEREQLRAWSRGRSTPHRLVLRARIVLEAAEGLQNKTIAAALGTEPDTVSLWRRRFQVHRLGPFTPPLAGMAFAFGWTPCVGPFLGSLLALSAASGTYTQGMFYLAIYSAGLALPFLISALLFTSLLGAFSWIKRRLTLINVFAGLFLVGMGIALLTGRFNALADSLYYQVKLPDLSADAFSGKSVGIITSFVAGLLSFLSPCVLPLVPGYLSFISGVTIDEFTKHGSKNGAKLS